MKKLLDFYSSELCFTRKGIIATLTKDIIIILHCKDEDYELYIEKGFKWNGNSGCFPCRFHKENERYNVAILTHDVLYHDVGLSKEDSDDILRGALRESGYGRVMAGLIHKAVQLFGKKAFGHIEFKRNKGLIHTK